MKRIAAGLLAALLAAGAEGQPVRPAATPFPFNTPQAPPWQNAASPTPAPYRTPLPEPRATVTPRPTPSATPAAVSIPPALPAVALNPVAPPHAAAPVPAATMELVQVRVVRALDLKAASVGAPVAVTALGAASGDKVQDLLRPGLAFVFRVTAPENCGLLDFRNPHIVGLTDQRGAPIVMAVPAGGTAKTFESSILSWSRREALIQFNAGLPPRTDERIGAGSVELSVEVGVVAPMQVNDLRSKQGQVFLDHPEGVDLTVKLESIDGEKVVLAAEGAVKRLGEYEFLTPAGEIVQPYSSSIDVQATQPEGRPRQLSTFQFFNMPPAIAMRINYHPAIEVKNMTMRLDQTPLP